MSSSPPPSPLSPPLPSPPQPDINAMVGHYNAFGEQLARFKNIPAVDNGAAILEQLAAITANLNNMDAKFTTNLNNMDAKFTTSLNNMDAKFTAQLNGLTTSVNDLRASMRAT